MARTKLAEIISAHEEDLLSDWVSLQMSGLTSGRRGIDQKALREQCRTFLSGMRSALERSDGGTTAGPEWNEVRSLLENITQSRLGQGFTPREIATFVLSFKQPLFSRIRQAFNRDADALADETWNATILLDSLGLFTTEVYQKARNEVILRQQEEMLELSTPVVQLWQGILAVPLIGTLDSARTQVVMQNLLEAIVVNGAQIAIIDITGVPTVDTLVAQHLLKTVAAARLMGADCIISGIRPQIAQTIIHLGVDLTNVSTKSNLADAFAAALRHSGATIVRGRAGEAENK